MRLSKKGRRIKTIHKLIPGFLRRRYHFNFPMVKVLFPDFCTTEPPYYSRCTCGIDHAGETSITIAGGGYIAVKNGYPGCKTSSHCGDRAQHLVACAQLPECIDLFDPDRPVMSGEK